MEIKNKLGQTLQPSSAECRVLAGPSGIDPVAHCQFLTWGFGSVLQLWVWRWCWYIPPTGAFSCSVLASCASPDLNRQ